LNQQALDGWISQAKTGNKGASLLYTDSAILCALTAPADLSPAAAGNPGTAGLALDALGVRPAGSRLHHGFRGAERAFASASTAYPADKRFTW